MYGLALEGKIVVTRLLGQLYMLLPRLVLNLQSIYMNFVFKQCYVCGANRTLR